MASKIKVDQIEGSTGSSITIPTGQTLTITDGIAASTIASGTLASARLPTVPVSKGGTGLTSLGSAGQVVQVASGGSTLEFATPSSGTVKQIVQSTGTTVLNSSSSTFVATPQTITITPTSASSKIVIQMVNAIWSTSSQYFHLEIRASGGATGVISSWGDWYTGYYGNTPIPGYHKPQHNERNYLYTVCKR